MTLKVDRRILARRSQDGHSAYGRIVGFGELKGEPVAYVIWDIPKSIGYDRRWLDTVRARDVISVGAA